MKLKLMLIALAAAGLAACGSENPTESKTSAPVSTAPAQPAQPAQAADQPAEQPKVAEAKEAAPAPAAPVADEENKGDDNPPAAEKKKAD